MSLGLTAWTTKKTPSRRLRGLLAIAVGPRKSNHPGEFFGQTRLNGLDSCKVIYEINVRTCYSRCAVYSTEANGRSTEPPNCSSATRAISHSISFRRSGASAWIGEKVLYNPTTRAVS